MTTFFQDRSSGNYRAVFRTNAVSKAYPGGPDFQGVSQGNAALVPVVGLVDYSGELLGTPGNPLATTANVSLVVGNVAVSTGGLVNQAPQSYGNGVTAPLQLDKNGYLKVNVEVSNGLTGTFTLNAPIPTGSNTIGNVGVIGNVAITGNVGVVGNATVNGSVAVYTSTSFVQVQPTVTATTYTTGYQVGGLMTFANALRAPTLSGVLQSISIVSKSVQTNTYAFYLFKNNPTNTTWTNNTAPSINAADLPYLVGVYSIPAGSSGLGTMTLSVLDNIGQGVVGIGTELYGVLVATGTPTYASTSDLYVNLSVLKD